MNPIIRPERVADYSAIAALNYESFVNWHPAPFMAEPLLVDMLRHHELFDPELSLVAEEDGRVIGHALFTPFEGIILGTRQRGVYLAPLCVAPDRQRSGIGSALLAQGHELARQKGYALALLCGHPEYYPRFGYQQRMFALSGCKVRLTAKEQVTALAERPIRAADLPWVTAAWERQHHGDSLAIYPGETIGQWFSHSPSLRSSVFCRGEQIVGYARYKPGHPGAVRELLAKEGCGEAILSLLAHEHCPGGEGEFSIALEERTLRRLLGDRVAIADERSTFDALMLKPLDPQNEVVTGYCAAVGAGQMAPGVMVFPPPFDIDG